MNPMKARAPSAGREARVSSSVGLTASWRNPDLAARGDNLMKTDKQYLIRCGTRGLDIRVLAPPPFGEISEKMAGQLKAPVIRVWPCPAGQ